MDDERTDLAGGTQEPTLTEDDVTVRQFTQAELNRIAKRERERGRRQALAQFGDLLGDDPGRAAEELRAARQLSAQLGMSLQDALAQLGGTDYTPVRTPVRPQPTNVERLRETLGDAAFRELSEQAQRMQEDEGIPYEEALKTLALDALPKVRESAAEAARRETIETIRSKGLHAVDRADDKGNLADTPTLSAEEVGVARRLGIKPEAYLKRKLARERERQRAGPGR